MIDRAEAFLVLLAQTGDREALGQLLERVQPRMRGYLRMLTRDPARADDVLQDVFVIAVRKLVFLRDPALFRPWLYRIATREAHRRGPPAATPIDDVAEPASASALEQTLIDTEAREQLRARVGELPPMARDVIVLHYFEEMALHEVAAVLDAPLGTVKSRLASGLTRLRQEDLT
jgi:RNA polymerase sigma-70 factor (ECF subfamily)